MLALTAGIVVELPYLCFGGSCGGAGLGAAEICCCSGLRDRRNCCWCALLMTGGSFANTCARKPNSSAILALSHIPAQSLRYG